MPTVYTVSIRVHGVYTPIVYIHIVYTTHVVHANIQWSYTLIYIYIVLTYKL